MTKNNQSKTSSQPAVIDFGNRTVSTQNYSKIVSIPKEALANCGCNVDSSGIKINIQLIKDGEKSFIKLVPVCEPDKERGGESK